MNKEIRSFNIENKESRKVGGYAVVFNSLSVDLGGFREIIAPESITQELIDNSDVILNYNHDNNIMLGRSRNGQGTLTMRLDEHGLYFECDLPDSPMGDNVLESVKRGDLSQCSFAFAIDANDDGAETWEKREDGIYRTINRIAGLYDCSLVNFPAYEETEVSQRAKNIIDEMNNIEEIKLREAQEDEDNKIVPQDEEEKNNSCDKNDDEEMKSTDEEKPVDDENEEEAPSNDENNESDDDEKHEDDKEETKNTNRSINKTMKQEKFSLLKAIRDVANNRQLDDATQAVVNEGLNEMRDSRLAYSGQIQIPVGEKLENRSVVTVTAEGEDVVVTDFLDILAPLQDNLVLRKAGAKYITGLKGDVQIPNMSAENVGWASEIGDASDGAGSFGHVSMSPKRLTAYIDISKMFLAQDTLGAENMIRQELVNAIGQKLEATILSDDAGDTTKPAGLFYNVNPTEVSDFKGLCELEAGLEENNFWNEGRYILSPSAKAALRAMPKSSKMTQLVLDDNTIDGIGFDVTNHIEDDCFAYGDWSQVVIGQWGVIDITVDNFTQATKGCVRLVVNCYFDAIQQRPNAIAYGKVVEDDGSNG